jgi:hypothetical protein
MIHELSSISRTDCRTGLGSGILVTDSEYIEEGSQAEVKGLAPVLACSQLTDIPGQSTPRTKAHSKIR